MHRRVRLRLQPRHVPVLADPGLLRIVVVIFERRAVFGRRRSAVPRVGVGNARLHGDREGVVRDDPAATAAAAIAAGGSRRRRGRGSEEGGTAAVRRVGRIVEIETLLPERGLRPGHEFVHDSVDVRVPPSHRRRCFIRYVPPRRGIRTGFLSMSLDRGLSRWDVAVVGIASDDHPFYRGVDNDRVGSFVRLV